MRNSEKPNRTRCPEHPRREDRKTAMFKKNQDQKLSYKALNNSTTQAKGSLWCYFCLYNSSLFFIDDKSYVGVFILAESKERESFSLVPMRNSALGRVYFVQTKADGTCNPHNNQDTPNCILKSRITLIFLLIELYNKLPW